MRLSHSTIWFQFSAVRDAISLSLHLDDAIEEPLSVRSNAQRVTHCTAYLVSGRCIAQRKGLQ